MVWTAPLTVVDDMELTADMYNTYIRDNMLEMAVAKATVPAQYFTSEGFNKIGARQCKQNTVATSETTTSTEYTNLDTVGPSITLVHGKVALVFLAARMSNSSANQQCAASFTVSGASHVVAHDRWKIKADGTPSGQASRYSMARLVRLRTPGTSTFTMKYRVGGGTGTFSDREICVLPL